MTRFSHFEIKTISETAMVALTNNLETSSKVLLVMLPTFISQLLEENRILREGLKHIEEFGQFQDKEFGQCYTTAGAIAKETLTKADQIGKGEGGHSEKN